MNELLIIALIVLIAVAMCFAAVCFCGSPFVPTRKKWIDEALGLIEFSKNDLVVDLGAGNGKILRILAQKNIKSIGYEINPLLVFFAKISLLKTNLATVKMENYWKINLPKETTTVYAFMVQRDAKKLEKYLSRQVKLVNAKNIKLITFGFDLPNKKPVKTYNGSRLYIFD